MENKYVQITYGEILNIRNFFIGVEDGSQKKLLYKMIYTANGENMKDSIESVYKQFEQLQEDNKETINGYGRYKAAISYIIKTTDKDKKELIDDEIKRLDAEYEKELKAYDDFNKNILEPFMACTISTYVEAISMPQISYSEYIADCDIPLLIFKLFVNLN